MTNPAKMINFALLLALLGGCYWLGQWYSARQSANQAANARPKPLQVSLQPTYSNGSVDDVVRLLILSGSSVSPHNKYGIFLEMTRRMNPNQLVELIKNLEALPGIDPKYLTALFYDLSSRAPELTLPLINDIADAKEKKDVTLNLLQHLSMQDPRLAVSELAKLPPADDNADFYLLVYSALAKTDLVTAQATALSLPAGVDRVSALQGIGRSMAISDPQGAINWAQSLSSDNQSVLETVLIWVGAGGFSGGNPNLAASYLDDLTDPAARNEAILRISASWGSASGDPTAALAWVNQVATGDTYNTAVSKIVSGLTGSAANQQNIPAAIALLANITEPAVRESAISTVAANWSATAPSSAVAWAQTLPSTDSSVALNSIVASWSKTDPAAALAFVQNSTDSSTYLSSAPALAQNLAEVNPQVALAFAESLPAGTTQAQALNNVLTTEAQTNFTDAWNFAAALSPGDSQNTILTNLVEVEAGKDPAQAAALLSQIPDSATQLSATSNLSATWIKLDPQAFTNWIDGLPAGNVRDDAIEQLANSSQASKNPAVVLQWVNTVSNPQTKAVLLQQLGKIQVGGGPSAN